MRFLTVASAVLTFATALSTGAVVAPYASPVAVGPAALTPARPTISAGDISGAAIDAQVEVADHLRAAVDAERQLTDKAAELQGQAIDAEQENTWRAIDNVKTIEAVWDGAAARDAPTISKNIVRNTVVPVGYNAPVVKTPVGTAPVVPAPVESTKIVSPTITYRSAPAYESGPVASASSPVAYVSSPVAYPSTPISYSTSPVAYPSVYSSPIEYTQHLAYDYVF